MKRLLSIALLLCTSMAAWCITPRELGDSIHAWCGFPSCVPHIRVKVLRTEGNKLTLQCNKVLAGKALTADEIAELKSKVSEWVGPNASGEMYPARLIRILTDDHEIGELAITRHELERLSPESQPLQGKTIVLWASHGRYYNAAEERWVWQRARLWGTVEDRLTTEYTTRLCRLLEASGARVLQPRYTPGDSIGRSLGPSGLPRWMEGATYTLREQTLPESVWMPKGKDADYKNDMVSRPTWVNYLTDSLHEHVDLVLALHTDGYDEPGDSTSVGTLAIYYDRNDEGKTTLRDGRSRSKTNRQMAAAIHGRLVEAMRREVWDAWGKRQVLCANYAEARIPNVPAVLIEIGSHKDIDDAQYLLDPRAMDVAARGIYEGVCEALGAEGYVVFPTPTKAQIQTLEKGECRIINAFTHTSGPEWFRDTLQAGIVPGRYGIADSVNYALIGAQHDFDRHSLWVSDDQCGWGMCDTRFQRLLTRGNTHDYHRQHAEVLPEDVSPLIDLILGRQPEIPLEIQDSIRAWESAKMKLMVSGAYIGQGPMVRESALVLGDTTYTIFTEPNETALYCNESRSLKAQPGDTVIARWQDSGLPAIVRHGNTLYIGTMLESIVGWEELYREAIKRLND